MILCSISKYSILIRYQKILLNSSINPSSLGDLLLYMAFNTIVNSLSTIGLIKFFFVLSSNLLTTQFIIFCLELLIVGMTSLCL